MTEHNDRLETREPGEREADLFARLPDVLRKAMAAPAYAERLGGIDPAEITGRAAPAWLPLLLRKSDLPALLDAASSAGSDVSSIRCATTKLGGHVELVAAGSLPNDGKVKRRQRRG
jgi:phenylacetate-CoA ligase